MDFDLLMFSKGASLNAAAKRSRAANAGKRLSPTRSTRGSGRAAYVNGRSTRRNRKPSST